MLKFKQYILRRFEMKLLVTGGAGFIGSNFILHMLEKYGGLRIICLDKLTYAADVSYLKKVWEKENFRFVKGDICDREAVYSLFAEEMPDAVVNFAAESHVDRSIGSPEIFLQTNVTGTSVLMDACLKYGTGRFHQISTDEVYGDLPADRPDLLFTEESPLRPSSPYSSSKAAADMLALAYFRTYGLPVTITRCSNNYGPFQHTEKLIPMVVSKCLSGEKIPVYGRGENVRDWIHVSDHCTAIEAVLSEGRTGQVYNVGGGCEMRNIDLVKMICSLTGRDESLIEFVPDRKGHDLRYGIDYSRLEKETGWHPRTDFAEGLKKTVEYYEKIL